MRKVILFSFLLVGLILFCDGFGMKEIDEIATQCCTAPKRQCCVNMIKFGLPVRCGYEKNAEWVEILYDCVQKGLLETNQRMNLFDGHCCQVFGNDPADSNNQCERTCKLAMQSPSLDKKERFEKIRKCSTIENPRDQCFHNCLKLREDGISIEVLEFSEYCNHTNNQHQ